MYNRLLTISDDENQTSFLLLGPRGTGKTSWLKTRFPRATYIDLLNFSNYRVLLARPETLTTFIPQGDNNTILIDEVQRVPELLNEVHRLIEHEKKVFILTGSSARSLRKKGVNLLAGRAIRKNMYPLTAVELGDKFKLENSLNYGHLPSVIDNPNPSEYLKTYVRTYLQEVLQEGLTRNLEAFSRFLEIASFSQGSLINLSAIARETQVSTKIVTAYFSILEDLLLAHRISVFSKKAKRRLVNHQKFYYFDVGVYRHLRPKGPLDSPEEIGGIALESLVFQEILAINDYYHFNYEIFFWRTERGTEVDFILYGERGIVAIEVKSSSHIDSKALVGLKAFKEDYPLAKCYIFYGGDRTIHMDNDITVIPVSLALKTLPELLK